MLKTKSTKRALLMSALSLLLCISMLIGTTFAWFTESVASGNNIIASGNLDAELYWSADASNWQKVDENTNVFDANALWEPGHTEVVYLKVVNEGSLAFKYHLGVNVISETTGVNVAGEKFKLSNYIEFGTVETATAFADRAAARAAVTDAKIVSAGYSKGSSLPANDKGVSEEYVALVVYMPETVGNEANYKTGTVAPEIKLGINLVATQYTYEDDSYGNDYDTDALPADVIATPENIQEVLDAAKPGDVIGLADGAYYDMSIVIPCDDITLVSNTAIADHVNVNGKKNVKIVGITFDAYAPHEVKDPKANRGILANITSAEGSKGAENLQIINCKFVDLYGVSAGKTDNYCPITIYDRQRTTGASNNITIDGCTFDTNAAYYVYMYYPGMGNGDIVINNNTFGNANTTLSTGTAVYVGATKNNVTVVNNTITNSSVTITPHNNASCTYALKISVAENNFINTTGADATVIGLRNFYNLPKCNTYVEGNIANNGYSKIKAPYVDAAAYECYDVAGDSTIAAASDTKGVKDAIKNGAEVILVNGANVNLDSALNTTSVPAGKTVTIADAKVEGQSYGNKVNGTVVFENCTFEADVYSIHFDGGTGKVIFNNCTLVGWSSFGSVEVEMNNCTIKGNGKYGVARFYKNVVLKDCVIDVSDVDTTDDYQDGIDIVSGYTATVINCTNVNGDIADVFEAEDIAGTDGIVVFQ